MSTIKMDTNLNKYSIFKIIYLIYFMYAIIPKEIVFHDIVFRR